MFVSTLSSAAVAAVALFASSVVADVDPIIISGSKFFFKSSGAQFFIKGVAYQQDIGVAGKGNSGATVPDPLADESGCKRDIPNLVALKTNTIRVYTIDPTANHDVCMGLLADAGIYVLIDLSSPSQSITSSAPAWNPVLYGRYSSVIDAMAKYTNTLGFFAGNEVVTDSSNSNSIPFVKAAVRDMKAYIKSKNYRALGVGYASNDGASVVSDIEDYMNCGSSTDATIDFFGYNIYSWCGAASDFVKSNYQAHTQEFSNYSVPAFFAEYGCNTAPPRIFEETLALYGPKMSPVWSGGIVFEYFQATNNYGLVTLSGNTVSKLPDFAALSTQMAKVTPTGVKMAAYTNANTAARACPTADGSSWKASTVLPPTPNEALCACMTQSLSCAAKGTPSDSIIATLFNVTCGTPGVNCDGIKGDGAKGVYGAYSMCSPVEQLSWSMNAYFLEQQANNAANTDACNFAGNATTQSATAPSGTCSSLLGEAGGISGTGTVTSVPTGGQAAGGAGSSSSTAAASSLTVPAFDVGLLKLGVYVGAAMLAGAGIVLM